MTTNNTRRRRRTLTLVVEKTQIEASYAGEVSTVAEMIQRISPVQPRSHRTEVDQSLAPDGAMLIPLTCGMVAIVDADDYPTLSQYNWQYLPTKVGYAVRKEYTSGKQTTVYMHRQINETTNGLVTDHKNGNSLDNRRRNLRSVTSQVNGLNRYPYIDVSQDQPS